MSLDDDDTAYCTDTDPLEDWLSKEAERKRFSPEVVAQFRAALQVERYRHIRSITSHLITVDYVTSNHDVIIEVLGERREPVVFNLANLGSQKTPQFVGFWRNQVLFAVEQIQDFIVNILLFDVINKSMVQIDEWDLTSFWTASALVMGRVVVCPDLGCALSKDEYTVLILGPPVGLARKHSCRLIDLNRKQFVKDIEVPGHRWVASAAFHRNSQYQDVAALICCKRFEFVTNYARPNVTGSLLLYDTRHNRIRTVFTQQDVSSEILKFSSDGDFLFVRFNAEKTLVLFDGLNLTCLRLFHHDVSRFPPGRHRWSFLYLLFPLVSLDERLVAMIQYTSQRETVQVFQMGQRVATLKKHCRRIVLVHVKVKSVINDLPIPMELKDYLLEK